MANSGAAVLEGAAAPWAFAMELLRRAFGVEFHLADGETGELRYVSPGQPARPWLGLAELCREVARRGRPEFIEDEPPLVGLAIPIGDASGESLVAVADFVTRPVPEGDDLAPQARRLDIAPGALLGWASRQRPWNAQDLDGLAALVVERLSADRRLEELEQEARSLSVDLASTHEEISLLYRLTHNLKISERDEDLGRMALEWLERVLPAEGLALEYLPVAMEDESPAHTARTRPVLLTCGRCPVDADRFGRLAEHLHLREARQPVVVNRAATGDPSWPFPEVRQMIGVPLAEGHNLSGWLAAFNHRDGAEFGTVEASLLGSVAAIVGIHSGNLDLYRQQSELLAEVVRALTSAIDAKDPYTCGHSDRVARIAVRLAQELGCDPEALNTIYLAGLLHDIGKIGITDSVLRKPGKLTEAEYEHIKKHVQIGHKILLDLKKLDGILPVVLHHHEAWDGQGYPHRLPGEEIPLPARIVAVADAYDAMNSDRPYRKGLPEEKIEEIFRAGAGKQWDPEVIAAFFRARDDIRGIICGDGEPAALGAESWR